MDLVIALDQPRTRFALRALLERQPGFNWIGEAVDAQELLDHAHAHCPDLALLDWELPGMPIRELIDALRQGGGKIRVIILSSRAETRDSALDAGADGFVCMCNAPDELLSAIHGCRGHNQTGRKDPK